VYFLNEHFIPSNLENIKDKHLYNTNKNLILQSKILNNLEDMLDSAMDDDKSLNFKVISAYRSYTQQKNLKQRYVQIYGQKNADTFSATQGLSEHQLGTTVDFVNVKTGKLGGYEKTEEYD
jgi:D-alanyl-D-alanine carboxypeptidase